MRTTSELLVTIGEKSSRAEAASALARRCGACELLVYLADPCLPAMIPAPGFPATVEGGESWRDFLKACRTPGRYAGQFKLGQSEPQPAVAIAIPGLAAIFVGGSVDTGELEVLEPLLPLLRAALSSEQQLVFAAAEAELAREAANRANVLAAALEATRADSAKLNAQLLEEHRRKDDFLAMLGHELRNPLAALVTSIEVLRRVSGTVTAAGDPLDVMVRQTRQLSRLVEDLLDVSRVNHGRIALRREDLSLQQVLSDAIEATRPMLTARHHHIKASFPEQPLLVNADNVRLIQVFSNLLHNAAKYTDPGGNIEIRAEQQGPEVVVEVRDNGVGIPAEMLPRVFDLFAQARTSLSRAEGGLGIGLTLVRALVELHGGRVCAFSPGQGKGTRVEVRLPIATPHASNESLPETTSREADRAEKSLRVLVVDDNEDTANSLAEIMRLLGHYADAAFSGLTALQIAGQLEYDLVLLDIGLPGMDGYEVARRLRNTCCGRTLLVALTGYGAEEDKRRSREAGFDEHIVKPVMPDVLEQLLGRATARSHDPRDQ